MRYIEKEKRKESSCPGLCMYVCVFKLANLKGRLGSVCENFRLDIYHYRRILEDSDLIRSEF